MKTLKLFSLLACMILCSMTANAQTKVLQTPDEAEYFIKGDLSIQKGANGEPEYTLTNVSTKGIDIKMQDTFEGEVTGNEDVVFSFEDASTDYPGGFKNNVLQYWRFDDYEKIWQPESEVRQGSLENTTNKYMNIMLVVDCSSSLGSDFNIVRNNTLYFVEQLYNASPYGNIRLGIIAFSSIKETKVLDIRALNNSTKRDIDSFIRSLSTHNGTALYYSMDKALEMLEDDSEQYIKSNEYLGSYLITFTDGIDQQSQNFDKDIFVAEDYYNYIRPILKDNNTRKKIYGRNIETRILSVKGNDITSAKLEEKFDNDLKAICDNYTKMRNINELQNEFANISKLLIDKSMQLQCYVPMGFRGRVGWTFSSIKKEPVVEYKPEPIKVKKQKKVFLGVNAGVGAGFYSYSSELEPAGHPDSHHYFYEYFNGSIAHEEGSEFSIPFNVGIDFAFRLSDSFYLGAYGSIGMLPWGEGDYYWGNSISPSFGLLTMFNQKNENAIIIGAGTCIPAFWSYLGFNFRIGYKFKNNLYMFGEVTTCSYSSNWYDYETVYDPYEDYYKGIEIYKDVDASSTSFFLHFGYRIF